jgi:hypothetical protein
MPTHRSRPQRARVGPVLIGVMPLVVPALFIVARHPHIDWSDDRALTELAVRQAAHGRQLLGVGGRFGWRHPGPVWIYLLVPLYELSGHASWSLAVGALAIHVVMIGMAVGAATRSAGLRGAAVLSGLVAVYLASTGIGLWTNPWAGYAFTWPLLALVVVASIGMSDVRAGWALAGALAVGTLLVQTDVSTAVPVVTILAVATAVRLARFGTRRVFAGPRGAHTGAHSGAEPVRSAHTRGARRVRIVDPPAVALFAAAALAWVPPLIQQFTTSPGNMTLLVRFARQGAGGQSIRTALAAVGSALSVVPFGARWVLSPELGPHLAPGPWWAVVLPIVYAAAILGVAVVAYRRGRRWAADLAVVTLLALAAAVVSMSKVDGPINFYLLTWVSILPVPAVTSAVLALAPEATRRRDPVAILALAVGTVVAAVLIVGQGSTFDWDHSRASDVASGTLLAEQDLGRPDGIIRVHILTPDTWEVASGVALQLAREGNRIQVDPAWVFLFGDAYKTTAAAPAGELWFARPREASLVAGDHQVASLGEFDGIDLFARNDT